MTSSQYDVVVVGAGPSGSMTARYAAMGGCRTLLIEKRQEIGSPVRCGEGLARHFVEDTKLPFDRKWVGREVKGAKIFSPNGTELTIEEAHAGNEVGIVLERDAFDKAVAKEAAKEGADIWLKTTATADIKDYLDRWIEQDPRMAHAQPLDMVTGGVSTAPPIKKSVGNGMALVGDAARMIDPITGGGIGNGMLAGMMLGKVLSKCNGTGDFGEAALMEYEKGWRAKLEENLYRNWLAKNKLVTLSDGEFDDIIQVLASVGVTKLSVRAILKVLKETRPELVAKFAEFI